jgi:hypothetical protein
MHPSCSCICSTCSVLQVDSKMEQEDQFDEAAAARVDQAVHSAVQQACRDLYGVGPGRPIVAVTNSSAFPGSLHYIANLVWCSNGSSDKHLPKEYETHLQHVLTADLSDITSFELRELLQQHGASHLPSWKAGLPLLPSHVCMTCQPKPARSTETSCVNLDMEVLERWDPQLQPGSLDDAAVYCITSTAHGEPRRKDKKVLRNGQRAVKVAGSYEPAVVWIHISMPTSAAEPAVGHGGHQGAGGHKQQAGGKGSGSGQGNGSGGSGSGKGGQQVKATNGTPAAQACTTESLLALVLPEHAAEEANELYIRMKQAKVEAAGPDAELQAYQEFTTTFINGWALLLQACQSAVQPTAASVAVVARLMVSLKQDGPCFKLLMGLLRKTHMEQVVMQRLHDTASSKSALKPEASDAGTSTKSSLTAVPSDPAGKSAQESTLSDSGADSDLESDDSVTLAYKARIAAALDMDDAITKMMSDNPAPPPQAVAVTMTQLAFAAVPARQLLERAAPPGKDMNENMKVGRVCRHM